LFGTVAPERAVPADAPVTPPQYATRRELREAEARGSAEVAAVAVTPVEVTPVLVATTVSFAGASGGASTAAALSVSLPDFSAGGIQIQASSIQDAPSVTTTRRRRAVNSRKLRAAEVRRMHAVAPKAARKHPLSVLATMAVVGGLFAVAGLPAYALTNPETETAAGPDTAVGQSMVVSAKSAPIAAVRDGYEATTPEEIAAATKDDVRAGNNAKYLASGARELGDDYPWPYELGEEQGGGLSVLNYYYRQCTDFVAWRINRDAGSFKAPFKWVWSNLTPTGGNASQWKYAWEKKGWPVSNVPTVGAVAWFGSSNHVAYVKQVIDGGFVVIEEYNYVQSVYGQRTIPTSTVEAFLGAPVG
ncbi:CHAP domain-containing protein, partial [Salinibacterium sp.]|uniref:CHAP domain-containing protein n=1 Tax=Salinibacterium sp. TaxID=1915057 RepID=UPI00286C19B9